MKTIKSFKNNELLTFTENNKIIIDRDDNYEKCNIKKGYKMNLINSNKGLYKGSFMNNYICKKFRFHQKVNLTNIETNKILNYCRYFLLSENEYIIFLIKMQYYMIIIGFYDLLTAAVLIIFLVSVLTVLATLTGLIVLVVSFRFFIRKED